MEFLVPVKLGLSFLSPNWDNLLFFFLTILREEIFDARDFVDA